MHTKQVALVATTRIPLDCMIQLNGFYNDIETFLVSNY